MVVTRNMKRTAAESPAPDSTTKRQKLPVRSRGAEATPTKQPARKDETTRSSRKRAAFVVELRSEASPAKGDDVQEEQVITGAEQPAPEPEAEEKIINDSEASPESGNDAQEGESPEAETPAQPAEEAAAPAAEAGDDSDSDEAPEAVSTTKAAAQAKKSAQAANKAIAEQAAAQKRKRQERNTRLQEQAAARKAQKAEAPKEEAAEEAEEEQPQPQPQATPAKDAKRRLDRRDLPSELPAEFLESDSEDEDEGAGAERKPRKARKLQTAEAQIARQDRGPRDEVVGSTVFRVAKKEDERLAPKARKYAVNAKKALLVRGRTPVKARKGFLV